MNTIALNDITISFTSRSRHRELARTLESVIELPNIQVILNGAKLSDYREVMEKFSRRVKFVVNPKNIGIAAAWNQGIVISDTQFIILSSDDMEYPRNWFEPLLVAINSNRQFLQYSLSEPMSFSSFCLDKKLITKMGWFDLNFTVAYFEDEDWYLRYRENCGLFNDPKPYDKIIPRLMVVKRHPHAQKWNVLTNRIYFMLKWKKMRHQTEKSLYSRDNSFYRRRLREPSWPELEKVRCCYANGDFRSRPWVHDKPSVLMRIITALTSF